MKWKPDWSDIAENLLIELIVVVTAGAVILLCVCIWKDVTTEKQSSHETEINHTPARSAT